jgi:membrane-bound lytic murein transglycosylase MltF
MRWGVTNIYSPKQNIEAGVKYMRWLLDKFGGDVRLALAGYNAGEGAVKKYGNKIPPYRETRNYVARITANYERLTKQALAARTEKTEKPDDAVRADKTEETADTEKTEKTVEKLDEKVAKTL